MTEWICNKYVSNWTFRLEMSSLRLVGYAKLRNSPVRKWKHRLPGLWPSCRPQLRMWRWNICLGIKCEWSILNQKIIPRTDKAQERDPRKQTQSSHHLSKSTLVDIQGSFVSLVAFCFLSSHAKVCTLWSDEDPILCFTDSALSWHHKRIKKGMLEDLPGGRCGCTCSMRTLRLCPY